MDRNWKEVVGEYIKNDIKVQYLYDNLSLMGNPESAIFARDIY